MRFLVFVLMMALSLSAQALPWGLNDVSILYPLPANQREIDALIEMKDLGFGGELLPKELLKAFSPVAGGNFISQDFSTYRVLSVRIDPLEREIRLVWQGIYFQNNVWRTTNPALHSFYKLDEASWQTFKGELLELKAEANISVDSALQVHPFLVKEGVRSPFALRMKNSLLKHIGLSNLHRVALSDAAFDANTISFVGGFTRIDVVGGHAVNSAIPGVSGNVQNILWAQKAVFEPVSITVKGLPSIQPDLFTDLNSIFQKNVSESDLLSVYKTTLLLESPPVTRTMNIDCASCHLSTPVRNYLEQRFSNQEAKAFSDLKSQFFSSAFDVKNNLINVKDPTATRGFGYIRNQPSIIDRVIQDSVESASSMDR